MFSQEIKLHGHIIDSLILPKVLDEILSRGGTFKILEIEVGQNRTDQSRARIEVSGPTPEAVDELVRHLRQHGAELVKESEVTLEEAPADGVDIEPFLRELTGFLGALSQTKSTHVSAAAVPA